jgi:hypothetical protein
MVEILHDFFNFVLFSFIFEKKLELKRFDLNIKESHLAVNFGVVSFAIMPNVQN